MGFQVELRSPQQILGDLIRTVLANSDLTDVAPGSTLATLLEAIAASQYEISLSSLKILQSTNLESLIGPALDNKAASIKLPNGIGGVGRKPANQASGTITIGTSLFKKVSSKLYAGKPAPYAGSNKLYLENAGSFPPTGSVYLGRGTADRFEGPIPYSAAVNSGSFWTLTLAVGLTKNHLSSDLVILSQGGDRTIGAGTIVQIPANSENTSVQFATVQNLLIPDGEAEGSIAVTCTQFGEAGNALSGAINTFSSLPYTGATVTNPSSYASGRSTESDEDLRQRIKNYPATLGRGTNAAILAAVIGATDPTSGRTVQSAVILDPVEPGDSARVFIDDGTGLEPTFGQQAYELLLQSASGQETRFRTAQFPITAALSEGSALAPFVLTNGLTITVHVDEVTETYTIAPANYKNLNSATAYEVVRDLNSQSNIVGWRTMDNGARIVMVELSGVAETIRVEVSDWQDILGLQTATLRPIFLYKNSIIQSFRGHTATLDTRPRNQWSLSAADLFEVPVIVDGVTQIITITDADFTQFPATIITATIAQWATVLSSKIAGVRFTASGQTLVWSTWQSFSPTGTLEIPQTRADGTPAGWVGDTKMWLTVESGGLLKDVGYTKDFAFNRFTGEITFVNKPAAGSAIEIGSRSTRAHLRTIITSNGLYDLSTLPITVDNSRLVLGFDGDFAIRTVGVAPGDTIVPFIADTTGAPNVLRLISDNVDVFKNAKVGDWLYLVKDQSTVPAWGSKVEGFYRLKLVGLNQSASNVPYLGVNASTYVLASQSASTKADSATVLITKTAHGLKTGDKITVVTATAIGGIAGGNLSVTNASIVVLDANHFQYQALALATTEANGTLASVRTNVISVSQAAHNLKDGSQVQASVGGGLSGGATFTGIVNIEVIDANTYKFSNTAGASAAQQTGTIDITLMSDTWVEFEISQPQLADWTPLLSANQTITDKMIHIFRSTTIPQLVDFGNVATMTVDQVVASINSQIATGMATKVSPQQVEIRSSDFKNGSAAILAVIGSAANMTATGISLSQQSHIGYSSSGQTQAAFPVVTSVSLPSAPLGGYATRTYMAVDRDLTDIIDRNPNPTIRSDVTINPTPPYPEGFQNLWLTGRQATLEARVYNNQVAAPYTGLMRGLGAIRPMNESDTVQTNPDSLDRYANYSIRLRDLGLTNFDKLVVEMDLDPIDKTVAIQLSKRALIQDIDAITGVGKGQVISFRLRDPEDIASDLPLLDPDYNAPRPFFHPTSVYKLYDFSDFKLLTKGVGLYRDDVSNRALILRSADFGAPHRLRLSIRYAADPSQATVQMTHSNDFLNNVARLNLVAVLPSDVLIPGSTLNSGNYRVQSSAAVTLFSWRVTAGTLNSGNQYQPGNILNISGSSQLAGSYKITAQSYNTWSGSTATTTSTSNVVVVNQTAHGYQNGDYVDISASTPIGGISAVNLSGSFGITLIDANSFSYVANATATAGASGPLTSVSGGSVTVTSPGSGGLAPSALFSGAAAPVRSWAPLATTLTQLATAINAYNPTYPVATAEIIGTNVATNPISNPTYITYAPISAYAGTDMSGAFNYAAFDTHLSGSAGIWQYDSTVLGANAIKATVQTSESIYPTTTEASGTTYSPIGEEVYIVPSNTKSLTSWMNFNAASSLNILANIERIQADNAIEVSSKQDGSAGAVHVTGVTANSITSSIIGNATTNENATVFDILTADAKSMTKYSIVKIENTIAGELLRPYRLLPTGTSITTANTTSINNFFRQTNSIKYMRVDSNTGRLIFYRNGMGPGQTEPSGANLTGLTATPLGGGLIQLGIIGFQALLSARVGDMMYVRHDDPDFHGPDFYNGSSHADWCCKKLPDSGRTDPLKPEYIGYPVVHVINASTLIIMAPSIVTSFTGINYSIRSVGAVFMPAIWNEKNIQTNHKVGARFDEVFNEGKAYYLVKTLGNGFMSVFLQNSPNEATDNMLLNEVSVGVDDWAIMGEGFDPANQGQFRIVAHNGRNHMIVHNPGGGKDELFDAISHPDLSATGGDGGATGDRKWRVGPLNDGFVRPLRVLAGESVQLGDKIRISTPSDISTQWFNDVFFGSWTIKGIGLQGLDYTGFPLPHGPADGTFDSTKTCPYIDFEFPNAPIAVFDGANAPVDAFLIGTNDASIGFTEGTPLSVFRMVSGHAVNPQNAQNTDVFVVPNAQSGKFSDTFGSIVSVYGKSGWTQQAFQGIDGYKVYSGLVEQTTNIIDGLPTNTVLFPGVKAAGTVVEVLTPLIRSIQVALQIRPKDGVTLNSITDLVRARVASYINGLGVGKPVVLAEIIKNVQSLPGVFSVTILGTLPTATDDRIVVGTIEKAFVLDSTKDISVG